MGYIDLSIRPDGDLDIVLTAEGREFLSDLALDKWGRSTTDLRKGSKEILSDLFEDKCGNGWTLAIDGNSALHCAIGALTDSPIVSDDIEQTDDGEIVYVNRAWWFPNYMVESEVATLARDGRVTFTRADK